MVTLIEVYNNIPHDPELKTDWGFSCYIPEVGLLFDTGANGALLRENLEKLDIDILKIRYLVLSHDHWDHQGGLEQVLRQNPSIQVWIHDAFSSETKALINKYASYHTVNGWQEITGGIYTTGPLGDAIIEQSLAVRTAHGYLIVSGCAHPHIGAIIARVREEGPVRGAIGGFHSVSEDDLAALGTLSYLSASHCTEGLEYIIQKYPDTFVPGGAGKIHRLQD